MEQQSLAGLGQYLRSEREKRHITIEQVASATKINVKLLHALESDNYDALPAKPFVRGFVASYTRYVGLDPRDVLNKFEGYLTEKSGRKFLRSEDSPHIFVEKESQTDNNKTILSIVMGFFLVAAVVVFMLKPLKHRKGRVKNSTKVSNEELVTVPPPAPQAAAGGETASSSSKSTEADAPEKLKEALEGKLAKKEAAAAAKKPELAPAKPVEKTVAEKAEKPAEKSSEKLARVPTTPLVLAPPAEVAPKEPAKPAPVPAPAKAPEPPKPVAAKPAEAPKPVAPAAKPPESSKPVAEAPKPAEAKPVAAVTPPQLPTAPSKKPAPIPDREVKHLLIVRASVDSWVKYQPDDRPIMEFMLRKDKKIYIRARNSIRFKTGNPKGVEISLNHKDFIPYENSLRTLIIPESATPEFQDQPFITPVTP